METHPTAWLNFLIIGLVIGFVGGAFMAAWRSGQPPPEHLRTYRLGAPWRPSALKWGFTWSAVYGALLPMAFLFGGPTAAMAVLMVLMIALVIAVVSAESRHWRP